MGLYGAGADGCSREAPGVVRDSPRRGWLKIHVSASGDALLCTNVRPRGLGITLYLYYNPRRRAHTCTGTKRECASNLTGHRLVFS